MILKDSHFKELKTKKFRLAILPWGATEAHNYHLPYGTDNYETEAIAKESVKRASGKGAQVILLPGIPFGVNTGHAGIPFTVNMNPSTQLLILRDILESIEQSGINKLLVLNGHGGNDFRQILRELGREFPGMILATCNWFQSTDRSEIFENEGDHADELETSLMMYLHADLVLPLSEAGSGKAKRFRVKALNEKWAWSERKWTRVSEDTGIGDPSRSTFRKGEKYFDAVCTKISNLIYDLASAVPEKFYE